MTRSRDIADSQDNLGGPVTPVTAGKNLAINGGFDIWQRGTSFTTSGAFCADRYVTSIDSPNVGTIAQQTTSLPAGFRYSIRCQRNSGNTGTAALGISQAIESSMSIPAQGKTITFSYWAKAGANYSNSGSILNIRINSGTGIDQAGGGPQFGGWTGYAETAPDQAITTTWTRYTATYNVPSNATQLGFRFFMSGSGTAGANDWFEITGVQLEIGSAATPFSRAGGTLQGELAACQRYFVRMNCNTTTFIGQGMARNGTVYGLFGSVPLPTSMRSAPSLSISGLVMEPNAGGGSALNGVVANGSPNNAGFYGDRTGNWGADYGLLLRGTSSNNYLDASSEL